MRATATWKVIDNDHDHGEDDLAAPGRAWRNSEAECDAWIASVAKRHPYQAVLGYVAVGPFPAVDLPFAVIDRAAESGEARVLERFGTEREARDHIHFEERGNPLAVDRPHFAVVHASALEEALDASPTRLAPGDYVHVGTPTEGDETWFPAFENYAKAVVPRTLQTPYGTVEATVYPTGHLRVTAGYRTAGRDVSHPGHKLPPTGGKGGSVAFDAVLALKGNQAVLVGLKRSASDERGGPTDDAATTSLASKAAFAAVRFAAQSMADLHPNDRLESVQRHHREEARLADVRIEEALRLVREATRHREASLAAVEEAEAALERVRSAGQAPAP